MELVADKSIQKLSLLDAPKRPTSADILCHNCDWSIELQERTNYTSTIKCFFGQSIRAVWQIGDDYILKERPIINWGGDDYMGPDVVTTDWVRENTTIPVSAEIKYWKDSHSHFFLMKKVPGESLQTAWPRLNTEEKKKYACEVAEYIAQLRTHTAPKPQTVDGAPARNTLLKIDEFIDDSVRVMTLAEDKETWWAYAEKAFTERSPSWRESFKARYPNHTAPYVLSHGDLNTGNIMVHDGHVSGIIDWEHAGYYPDWWEYAYVWTFVQEPEWQYYLETEIGKRCGEFKDAAMFCMDLRMKQDDVEIDFAKLAEKNKKRSVRDKFCDCKPYRNCGLSKRISDKGCYCTPYRNCGITKAPAEAVRSSK